MNNSPKPHPCDSRYSRPLRWHPSVDAIGLVGSGLVALVIAAGCADPLMRKSQLPETIDYSGGDSHQAPALPPVPATAPTAEVLKPVTIPSTPATTEPIGAATRTSDANVRDSATGSGASAPPPVTTPDLQPTTLPATLPSDTTRPGL